MDTKKYNVYNVYIVRYEDGKAVKRIWEEVSRRMADRIERWADINLDHKNYAVFVCLIWSARDNRYKKDLMSG